MMYEMLTGVHYQSTCSVSTATGTAVQVTNRKH